MKPKLKLKYADFYKGWDKRKNLFTYILSNHYDLEFSDDPDLLIFQPFGTDHLNYRCRKVFVTGENYRPDFNVCDFAITFDYLDDPRNYRFPLGLWSNVERPRDRDPAAELRKKSKFCNFVVSNPSNPMRNDLFKKLSRYKQVDSGGRYLNNVGGRVDDKLAFTSQYKFTIAYENGSRPGYLTEKIADAFAADTIPIYWGDPLVHRDFNPKSFINFFDYGSNEAVIERVKELDQNDDAYLEVFSQPHYAGGTFPQYATREAVAEQFKAVIESDIAPVASRSQQWTSHLRCRANYKGFKWSRRLARWKHRLLRV